MRHWRLFLIVEVSLLFCLGWQIFSNPPYLIFLILGLFSLYLHTKAKRRLSKTFYLLFGILALVTIFLTSPFIWLMLFAAFLYFILSNHRQDKSEFLGMDWLPWTRKHFFGLHVTEPTPKHGQITRRPWFGNQTIGQDVFAWDDVNLTIAAGDTIIDLGNTLLPKRDNIIMIRKGFGRTRILVPVGTAVQLKHTALIGAVTFNNQTFHMNNDELTLYSDDYDDNERRVKVLTNVLAGDLEVLFV
jgi:predicted membrane protein